MANVNKIILLGRLGQDPILSYTPGGIAICKFSVATSEKYKDKQGQQQEKTEWHNIIVWAELAETCNRFLSVGREVYIEGKSQTRSWDDKKYPEIKHYMNEVNASKVEFIGTSEKKEKTSNNYAPEAKYSTDDIPF